MIFLFVMLFAPILGATFSEPTLSGDPALATSFLDTFTNESEYFDAVNPDGVSYTSGGLELIVSKEKDNPSLQSNHYIMFGRVEVVMKAAKGTGMISSFYLQSDDLDEIDIELFGSNSYQFSSNYFIKGNTSTHDRGQYHLTGTSPLENYHIYTLDWTELGLAWALDGKIVRTILPDNEQGYPLSPMYIMLGLWAGGDSTNSEGTIEWAGGLTDFSKGPFAMNVKSIIVTDYSSGKYYFYDNDRTEAEDGEVNSRYEKGKDEFAELEAKRNSISSSVSLKSKAATKKTTKTMTTTITDAAGLKITAVTTTVVDPKSTTDYTYAGFSTVSEIDSYESAANSYMSGVYGYHTVQSSSTSRGSGTQSSSQNTAVRISSGWLGLLVLAYLV